MILLLLAQLLPAVLSVATPTLDMLSAQVIGSSTKTIKNADVDSNGFVCVLFNDSSIVKYDSSFNELFSIPNPNASFLSMKIFRSNSTENVLFPL